MKIIIIHGDDVDKIAIRLDKFKVEAIKRKWLVRQIEFDGKNNIFETINSNDLFCTEQLYILYEPAKFREKELKWLFQRSQIIGGTLVITSKSLLSKNFIKKTPNVSKVEKYQLPEYLWKFLESFYPGNQKQCLNLFHSLTDNQPVQFVFSMLSRQLASLYMVKLDSKSMKLPPWRLSKLKNHAKKFTKEKLKLVIQAMSEIDIKAKTSNANLGDLLDLLIVTELKLS